MLTTFNEVDMSQVVQLRTKWGEQFQKKHGEKLGFLPFFVKATILALKKFPDLHSYLDGEEIVRFDNFDLGIAVSTDRGLIVPVIRHCDTASFAEIEIQIARVAEKARKGTLSIEELKGASFTITNGGVFGSLFSTPILNPPQSGILALHAIQKRAVVVDEQILIRPMIYLALSYDHRIVDGRDSIQFLMEIKKNLEKSSLIDEERALLL